MRKTSLDELPQLLNVLLGDMSLVGYRPNVSDLIDWSDEAYLRLLCMRPGITGYAQVYGRSNNTYESAMEKNTRYLRDASFGTDLKLIFLTAARVFGGAAEAN